MISTVLLVLLTYTKITDAKHHHHGSPAGYDYSPFGTDGVNSVGQRGGGHGSVSGYEALPLSVHVTPVHVGVAHHDASVDSSPAGAHNGHGGPGVSGVALAVHSSPILVHAASPGVGVHGGPLFHGRYQPEVHAAKAAPVETVVPVHPVVEHVKEIFAPQPYTFGYETVDEHGNKQVRHEESDANNIKKGSYGFHDANGIYRHVKYVADEHGFRASIQTNEPGTASSYTAGALYNANPHPVKTFTPSFAPIPPPTPVEHAAPVGHNLVAAHASSVEYAPSGPQSSVEYVPQPGATLEFVPSAPSLSKGGGNEAAPLLGHHSQVEYVTAGKEDFFSHPLSSLRSAPPIFFTGYSGKYY
ncbi:hypothetical protein ISCGN_018467 [Ixodes scapularis]